MDFDGVKKGLSERSILLIDVRTTEAHNEGRIPGSHNIPCEIIFLMLIYF